jgi:hypothetical protein
MPEPLEALAARAADEPFFLAWLLAACAYSEGWNDASLAAALGCPREELVMLRLCRAPRTEPKEFWEDIASIAERFGLVPERLTDIVKRGRVVRRFQEANQGGGHSLLAARDHDVAPTEPPPGET